MLITGTRLCWNAEGRTRATVETSIGDGDPYTQHHQVFSPLLLSIPMYSYDSDGELGLSIIIYYTFPLSSLCYFRFSCCLWHGDLLYIDLTLQFARGRRVLYPFLYTDLSRHTCIKPASSNE